MPADRGPGGHHEWALLQPGGTSAVGAGLLFGASAPLARLLLLQTSPWLLAGLLYLGSGLGLSAYRWWRHQAAPRVSPSAWGTVVVATFAGGVCAPVLLMVGLRGMAATHASLLLNLEGVFTVLLARFAFGERVGWRLGLGMAAILSAAVLLTTGSHVSVVLLWPVVAVASACAAWALDNNLTRRVALIDATWLAALKGVTAGIANTSIALALGATWPPISVVVGALGLGSVAYGLSLVLFIRGLRDLGAARTSAYFSVAPFFGAALAVPLLGEAPHQRLLLAGVLMAVGVWLQLSERHSHIHVHEAMGHEHAHTHDLHHLHEHAGLVSTGEHNHWHHHEGQTHTHPHAPDIHHRHGHP